MAPGPSIEKDPTKAAALARELNDYLAKLRDDDPQGYGFFGSVPSLLDTEACLKEIAYVFDVLHADGVTLFTRYGSGNHNLGHTDFKPIWAELSCRKAVVFIHPSPPVDTNPINKSMPQPMFDYPHETGRTAMDLIVNNTLRTYPGCKIILSHAGGTLPYLIHRPAAMLPLPPFNIGKSTEEIIEEARLFYFDTALSANPITLKALFELAKPGHVMFGSDFPNAPKPSIEYFTKNLGDFELDEKTRREVYYEGALELFPRLKANYK
jgi:6-methylsalicylate decarboxylase